MHPTKEISRDVFPFLKEYKDGTIERLAGTETVAAGFDPKTNVLSKDSMIVPKTGVSARIYRPSSAKSNNKLPLLVYYHGGGFFISSASDPKYHQSLNNLVAEAKVILVSVDYRIAPETPLPGAYEDSWSALQWLASHVANDGSEPWLKDYADFDRVFLAGDSCGANMAHHFALRLAKSELGLRLKVQGIAMVMPYFWGKEPIGVEVSDHFRKTMVDNWWLFVCPTEEGCDDPLINPFTEKSPSLDGLACSRLLVVVAERDILRDRGKVYYEELVKSGWKGTSEFMELKGEDHVFHILNPDCENAKRLIKRVAAFIHQV